MTGSQAQTQPRQRARTLSRVRYRTGTVMIAYTALTALLWAWPKGTVPALWLFCLIPGLIFVLVVGLVVGKKATYESQTGPALGLSVPLGALWVAGFFIMGSGGSHEWALALLWMLATMVWPVVMILGLIMRFTLRKLVPGAAAKDETAHRHLARQRSIAAHRDQEIAYERTLQRELNSQREPTAVGRMTGLEPAALTTVEVPQLPHLFGTPGAGLAGSGFGAQQISKGQAGELNFARALQHTGQLPRMASFWSVHMPDETVGASTTLSGDIDCVLATGRSVYLLDVKNYTQGDVTWCLEDGTLRLIDNPSGGYIGPARTMSRNMELAVDRVREKLRRLGLEHRVVGKVVFMPTDLGMGTISPEVRWPGDIPAEPVDQTLAELAAEPDFTLDAPDSEHVVRVFRWLVKDETGSAPRPGEAWKRAAGMQRSRPGPSAPAPSPSAAEPARDARTPAPSSSTSPRTCVECGATFQSEWTFCWECGRA